MTISYDDYAKYFNKDRSSDPVYRFISAMLKAAEIPGAPGRNDLRKAQAFMALHDDVQKDMPDAAPEAIQAETERRWDALPGRQKDTLTSRPRPLSRVFADMAGPQ